MHGGEEQEREHESRGHLLAAAPLSGTGMETGGVKEAACSLALGTSVFGESRMIENRDVQG